MVAAAGGTAGPGWQAGFAVVEAVAVAVGVPALGWPGRVVGVSRHGGPRESVCLGRVSVEKIFFTKGKVLTDPALSN